MYLGFKKNITKLANKLYLSIKFSYQDQDMGFSDPDWIQIAKHFIERYHYNINLGHIHSNENLLRFFLKLLKKSAFTMGKSIELKRWTDSEQPSAHDNGKARFKPKANLYGKNLFSSNVIRDIVPTHKCYNKFKKTGLLGPMILISIGFVLGLVIGLFF